MALVKRGHYDFRGAYPIVSLQGTAGTLLQTADQATTGADTTHDVCLVNGQPLTIYHGAASTNWIADAGATGWGLPCDATNNEGVIVRAGAGVSNANCPWCFTVGTDPAFYMKVAGITADPTVADAIGDCAFFAAGFCEAGAYSADNAIAQMTTQALMVSDADATPWTDVAMLSGAFTAGADVYTLFKTGSAAGAATDTTLGLTDATAFTFEVRVSSAGVVTCYFNGTIVTTPASGTPGTLTSAVVVQPTVVFVNGATATAEGAMILTSLTYGYQ